MQIWSIVVVVLPLFSLCTINVASSAFRLNRYHDSPLDSQMHAVTVIPQSFRNVQELLELG